MCSIVQCCSSNCSCILATHFVAQEMRFEDTSELTGLCWRWWLYSRSCGVCSGQFGPLRIPSFAASAAAALSSLATDISCSCKRFQCRNTVICPAGVIRWCSSFSLPPGLRHGGNSQMIVQWLWGCCGGVQPFELKLLLSRHLLESICCWPLQGPKSKHRNSLLLGPAGTQKQTHKQFVVGPCRAPKANTETVCCWALQGPNSKHRNCLFLGPAGPQKQSNKKGFWQSDMCNVLLGI